LLPKLFERFGAPEGVNWSGVLRYLPWRKL